MGYRGPVPDLLRRAWSCKWVTRIATSMNRTPDHDRLARARWSEGAASDRIMRGGVFWGGYVLGHWPPALLGGGRSRCLCHEEEPGYSGPCWAVQRSAPS